MVKSTAIMSFFTYFRKQRKGAKTGRRAEQDRAAIGETLPLVDYLADIGCQAGDSYLLNTMAGITVNILIRNFGRADQL
ncbi:MAG: hypothetical protein LBQ44_07175 [Treponema sp.]|jgi:hypothetical protein|nr:hypothetical protein [Treponema sp.]